MIREAGEVIAQTNFNAAMPDVVQVGGVYTPPCGRGLGFRELGKYQIVLFGGHA